MKLTPNEQMELQLALGKTSQMQDMHKAYQNQYANQQQNAAINNQAGQLGTGTANISIWGLGGGTVGNGGAIQHYPNSSLNLSQQVFGQQGFTPQIPQPSLDFQVDMIFAAVEKHLRKIVKEEIEHALQSIHESEI